MFLDQSTMIESCHQAGIVTYPQFVN